jgi:hypothetical protein
VSRKRTSAAYIATAVALTGWILRGARVRRPSGRKGPKSAAERRFDRVASGASSRPVVYLETASEDVGSAAGRRNAAADRSGRAVDLRARSRKELFDLARAQGVPTRELILMTKSEIVDRLDHDAETST